MVISKGWITLHKGFVVFLTTIVLFSFVFSCFGEEADAFDGNINQEILIDDYGAVYCNSVLKSFPSKQSIADYQVAPHTTRIGESAFACNNSLRSVSIPESVSMIEIEAFAGSVVESVTLSGGLLIIDEYAFAQCHNLRDLTLPDGLYAIGRGAFVECCELTSITIPSSVRYIGDEAFAKTSIHDIYFKTIDCCVEYLFLSHAASTKNVTVHFPKSCENDEIGDVDSIIAALHNVSDLRIVYDVDDDL